MSVMSALIFTFLMTPFTPAAFGKVSKSQPVRRGIASAGPVSPAVCTEAACLSEEVKKLSQACSDHLTKNSEGSEESSRRQFRATQLEIANKRRQILELGKTCSAFATAEICFDRSVKSITQKNPRRRDIKNENTAELLGFGSDILLKLGNQPGRSPAANSR